MIELLRRASARHPDRSAIVTDDQDVSYSDLVAMAESAAASLRTHGIRRLALIEPSAPEVVAILAGSALAGVEACQYPPVEPASSIALLKGRFDHTTLISYRTDLGSTGEVIAPDVLLGAAGWTQAAPTAQPLLILTTGTTGAPRGVRHDWTRLLRPLSAAKPVDDERWLLAYGLHQFAGLQLVAHVLAVGATLVAPTPRRPREGLAAIRRYGVTHVSSTPTYLRFALAEMASDNGPVPALKQITLGGEAVPRPLLAQVRAVFPDARISQIYAATEFGSTGSVRDGGSGMPASVLRRADDADVQMEIRDGELWVRSRVGMLGYYGDEPVEPDAWRPSGDLAEVVDDRVVFRGRASDVINVGGVKVHPLPIEEIVAGVPGVDVARVFGRPNAMTGSIVAVEIVAHAGFDVDHIAQSVRSGCSELPAAARPRSIRFVEELPLTGGKLVRGQTRDG
ncbi:class I adenylate-forming enzyme family protein [uncultured Jatrophihabitans sp.]|uniref:class I adenylate-forming enzyme family protein n=1 Tax=uncultured Jatrophihabitans sp. TaxID=1610747 RepID=UPI0035CA4753